ncbi:MAG: DUF1800 family protein [Granulosicoccus sp.]
MRRNGYHRIGRFIFSTLIAITGSLSASAFAYPTHILDAGQWSMISLPADPGPTGTIENLFGDDLPVAGYGNQWVVYGFDSTEVQYQLLTPTDLLLPNTGYWIVQIVADSVELDIPETLSPVNGQNLPACATGTTCIARSLQGSENEHVWNLVGFSSEDNVLYAETRFVDTGACANGCTPDEASAVNTIDDVLYTIGTNNEYVLVTSQTRLQPWSGYWLGVLPGATAVEWILPIGDIAPSNQPPVAADDTFGPVTAGEGLSLDVTANDVDSDGSLDTSTVSIVDGPNHGEAVIEADGQIRYTHDGSPGTTSDALRYTVQDSAGAVSNVATATITPILYPDPEPQNQPPVAENDTIGPINVGNSITFSVTANDTDSDGTIDDTTVALVSEPAHGIAQVEADGQITYTHNGTLETESDSLSYTVNDNLGASSNTATVTIAPILDDRDNGNPDIATQMRDAARLLEQGSFGPTDSEIDRVLSLGGPAAWIDAQLALPPTFHTSLVTTLFPYTGDRDIQKGRYQAFWDRAIRADDQLRQRVAFSLSHILVISDRNSAIKDHGNMVAAYYDVLLTHAFGNSRDLLQDVTLSPAMGTYLSMLGNAKPNIETGQRADENYAREVMQLFTIGLHGLNTDGSRQPGVGTYTQEDVENLARVFTGWAWDVDRWKPYNGGWKPDRSVLERPMVSFAEHHDTDVKTFLGVTLPAGQTAEEDLQMALDILFNHPNVGPFIGKQLIMRLVTSNPSPAYVARVASAFNDNGQGVRGDLAAVVKSILLDPEARNESFSTRPQYGKLRESILRYSHVWRAFKVTDPITLKHWQGRQLPQIAPLTAPSVFNFFQPGYSPPGMIKEAGNVAPEFQLNSESNVNNINRQLMRGVRENKFFEIPVALNLDTERALLADPDALLDHLDKVLLAGRLSASNRELLLDYITSNRDEIEAERILTDVIGLIATSTEFAVQR